VWNNKTALDAVCELFCGMLGRGDGGLRGINISGSGYNKVLALEVLNVVDCVELKRHAEFPTSVSVPRAVAARCCSRRACVRAHVYMLYVCAYMCVCMCVYEHAYMYVSACVYYGYTLRHMYVCTCVYVCVYMFVYRC